MAEGQKMPLAQAYALAHSLKDELAPACARIEIAGSIRRRRPFVSDIELVAIAKTTEAAAGLFDLEEFSLLDQLIDGWLEFARRGLALKKVKRGPKYQQFEVFDWNTGDEHSDVIPVCKLDLFITVPEQWGCCFLIRTGSADWIHNLVTKRKFKRRCPEHFDFRGNRLIKDGKFLDTPEEIDVFRALNFRFVQPEGRE